MFIEHLKTNTNLKTLYHRIPSEQKEFAKFVANDIFLFTCLHIVQKSSANNLNVISPFTFTEAEAYFRFHIFMDYLTQLDKANYHHYSAAQKILALQSAKVVNSNNEKIYEISLHGLDKSRKT